MDLMDMLIWVISGVCCYLYGIDGCWGVGGIYYFERLVIDIMFFVVK